MRQKILKALKTKYSSKGLSEKALDGVAAFLEKTVTDEAQIDAAISEASVESLINVYQSEADALRNAKAQAEKALADYKAAHPEGKPADDTKDGEGGDERMAQVLKELQELKDRAAADDARKRNSELMAGVRKALKDGNRGVEPLLDIVLKNPVIGADDTVETLTKRYETEYDATYKSLYGDGAVPPAGGFYPGSGGDGGKDDFSGVVARLRSEGKLAAKPQQ